METSLSLNITSEEADNGYFVILKQEPYKDQPVTLGEVAEALDQIFQINACDSEEGIQESIDEVEDKEEITEVYVREILSWLFDPSLCLVDSEYNYETYLNLWVSHFNEPYKVVVIDGKVHEDLIEIVEKTVSDTIAINNETSYNLEVPVSSDFTYEWSSIAVSEGSEVMLSGSDTLSFKGNTVGSLNITYKTKYYRIPITVFSSTAENVENALGLAFFHGMVDDEDIRAPEAKDLDDEEAYTHCGDAVYQFRDKEYDVTCYADEVTSYLCECTKNKSYETRVTKQVTCPDNIICGGGLDTCIHYLPDINKTSYVYCDEETWQGASPDYWEKKCCTNNQNPPPCKNTYSRKPGGFGIDPVKKEYYETRVENVKFIAVTPKNGDCGTLKETQVVKPLDCCDDIPTISIVAEETDDYMETNGTALITISGGVPPFTYSISGNGFSFHSGLKTVISDYRRMSVYGDHACGVGRVTVKDNCSFANHTVSSTEGEWVVTDGTPIIQEACSISSPPMAHFRKENNYIRQYGTAVYDFEGVWCDYQRYCKGEEGHDRELYDVTLKMECSDCYYDEFDNYVKDCYWTVSLGGDWELYQPWQCYGLSWETIGYNCSLPSTICGCYWYTYEWQCGD